MTEHVFTDQELKQHWDDLDQMEIDEVAGDPEKLIQMLEQKYGLSSDEAGRQVNEFLQHRRPETTA